MLEQIAWDVEEAKARDDQRGTRIIDDYADAHVKAADDPSVRQAWEEARNLKRELEALLERLEDGKQARRSEWDFPRTVQPAVL